MKEEMRDKAGLVYNVVEAVILGMSVCLIVWTAKTVIDQGQTLSVHGNQIGVNTTRLDHLEAHGSSGLAAHEAMDEKRVEALQTRMDKLENAVISLQSTPGELKAITARLEALKEGQLRIEAVLPTLMKHAP